MSLFTQSGAAARAFRERTQAGMLGVNLGVPAPMAFFSFGGWKQSLFGDLHVYGPEGIKFYTRTKAVTARWPRAAASTCPRSAEPRRDRRSLIPRGPLTSLHCSYTRWPDACGTTDAFQTASW